LNAPASIDRGGRALVVAAPISPAPTPTTRSSESGAAAVSFEDRSMPPQVAPNVNESFPRDARLGGPQRLCRTRRLVFYAYATSVALALLSPVWRLFGSTALARLERDWGLDKAVHAALFLGLTFLACWSHGGRPGWGPSMRILACAAAFGAVVEVVQSMTGYRTGELSDWAADAVGAAAGILVARATLDRPSPPRSRRT
jgi:VanZ family protein